MHSNVVESKQKQNNIPGYKISGKKSKLIRANGVITHVTENMSHRVSAQ